jgi:CheY-like chemotaxis protein
LDEQGTRPVAAKLEQHVRRRVVLVVDDDADTCELISDLLLNAGYQPLVANGGAAALSILRITDSVDLMIADVLMRDTNGVVLVEQARAMRPQLRIVFITGDDREAEKLAAGGAVVLRKPFGTGELITEVQQHLWEPLRGRRPLGAND